MTLVEESSSRHRRTLLGHEGNENSEAQLRARARVDKAQQAGQQQLALEVEDDVEVAARLVPAWKRPRKARGDDPTP